MEIETLTTVYDADLRRYEAAADRFEARQKQLVRSAQETARAIGETFNGARGTGGVSARAADAHVREFKAREREAARFAAEVRRINEETRRQAAANDRILSQSAKTLADVRVREARRSANEIIRTLEQERRARLQAERVVRSSGSGGGGFVGGFAAAAGVASVTATVAQGARAWLDYSAKLENARISFATMMGSAAEAEAHLKELQQFALKTPFEFTELVDASARMRALGFETKEVIPLLRDVGNVTAASGEIGGERLQRIIKALSDVRSRGALYSAEIRQFAEAAIPVYEILEKQLGKSRAELVKMVEAGKITAPIFLEAFRKFSQENFGDLMERQSRTFAGAMSNIRDILLQTAGTAFEPLYQRITEITVRFADELQGSGGLRRVVDASDAALEDIGRLIGRSIVAGIAEEVENFDIAKFVLSRIPSLPVGPGGVFGSVRRGVVDAVFPSVGAEAAEIVKAIGRSNFMGSGRKEGPPPAPGAGKGSEGAARRAARQALQLAQIEVREAESLYDEWVEIARRAYQTNLESFEGYVRRHKGLEEVRFKAVKAGFEEERRAAAGLPTAGERTVKLAEIAQRERAELRKHNGLMAQLTTDGEQHRMDVLTRFAGMAVTVQEERNRVLELDLARQVEKGTKTYVEAHEARLEALTRAAEKEQEVLRLGVVRALGGPETELAKRLEGTIDEVLSAALNASDIKTLQAGFKEIINAAYNPEAAQEALQAVLLFFLKRKQYFQEGTRDARDALEQDLQVWRSYADRLAEIFDSIQAAQFERQELSIAPLALNNFNRDASIEARRALEAAREEARAQVALDRLRQQYIDERTRQDGGRPDVLRNINAQIEAEEALHQARLTEISRQATEARREQMLEIAHEVADITTDIFQRMGEGWDSAWRGMLESALNVLRQIGQELMRMAFEGLLTGQSRGSTAGGIVGFLANTIGGALMGNWLSPSLPTGSLQPGFSLTNLTPGSTARGFATGGSFVVGGGGGTDSQLVAFRATPGERVDVLTPFQQARQSAGGPTIINNTTIINVPLQAPDNYATRQSRRRVAEQILAFVK